MARVEDISKAPRNGVIHAYVRAKTPEGEWVACHTSDLTEESFRQFVMQVLCKAGLVVGVMSDDPLTLYTKPDWKEESDVVENH